MHFQISTCTEATLADTTGVFPLPGAEGGSVALVRSPQKRKIGGENKKGLTVDPSDAQVRYSAHLSLSGFFLLFPPISENRKEASSSQR